ncbi:MAG: hypothetical protein JXQ90_19465 [Cyclobacteriaceae bacterium]
MLRSVVHYGLHFLFPGVLAYVFFKSNWKKAWVLMLCTMIIDLDHILAYPDIFVADRCSIGFHPLHSYWAIAFYACLLLLPKSRAIAVGLLLHMITDYQDCFWVSQ